MIELTVNGVIVKHIKTNFSDGAVGVKLEGPVPSRVDYAGITVKSEGRLNDELFEIASLVDILRACNSRARIHLFIPFTPYARQDRRMVQYDAFSLKVYAKFLNSLELDRVILLDAHSDAAPVAINNCVNIPQDFIIRAGKDELGLSDFVDVVVAPDAGAAKKVLKASIALGLDPNAIVYLEKVRDTSNGAITSTKVASDPSNIVGTNCLIVDDLCDGGATFISGAEALYKAGARSVGLFVTHGIFSRGLEPLGEAGIDKVWTTDIFISQFKEGKVFKSIVEVCSINGIFNKYFQGF